MDVHASAAATRAYEFVLPGTWAQIPLDTPEHARQAAAALVRQRVGRDDRLATVRRAVREDLVKTAAQAALNGADGLWLSLEILPGVPLPASMVTSVREWGDDGASTQERLRRHRPLGTVLRLGSGDVVRSSILDRSTVDPTRKSLAVEYVVPAPNGRFVLTVNGSAPVTDDGAPYLDLFDVVVGTLRWAAELSV